MKHSHVIKDPLILLIVFSDWSSFRLLDESENLLTKLFISIVHLIQPKNASIESDL